MIVTRFAPSPTGLLHLGHAYAAITARDAARGGHFLLRIEDIDQGRTREEFVDAIYEDLAWLGLDWENPVLRQSTRFDAYRSALEQLGDLLYPCFCTRKDIADEIARAGEAPNGPEGLLYPGTCRNLSRDEREGRIASGQSYALRLDVRRAAEIAGTLSFDEQRAGPHNERGTVIVDPLLFGDVVLARKDIPASYHLAVVVDDAFQDVNLVTRGNDLFMATHVQRLLQNLLGLPAPAYAHHKLILDEHGHKFSKRDRAMTLRDLRERSETPETIRAKLFHKRI